MHPSVSDTWERGDPYERYIGRWSREVAPLFLAWLNAPAGLRWLDVGCGTGALCAAVLDRYSPRRVTGVEPSRGFLTVAGKSLAGRADLAQGTAGAIPLAGVRVDGVVSGLVLNFVPDPRAALLEMARVTRPGGVVAAYVWDYAEKMEIIRFFWDAAVALNPDAARLDEGPRFPLCRPDALAAVFAGAGLSDVHVTPIDVRASFASFDDYWQPFLGGQGPAPAYTMSLDVAARARLYTRLREITPALPDGSVTLTARAWADRGLVS